MAKRAPKKPPEGDPCNGCGFCCAIELCPVAEIAGIETAPCRLVRFHDGRFWCSLVEAEQKAGIKPKIKDALCIGEGCDSSGPE